MTKLRKRRSSSVEHRSTKRRKFSSEDQIAYSDRDIPWKEQKTLPPRFCEEKGVWPALKILEERGSGRRKEYLLEWEAHPYTGERFRPTWTRTDDVGQTLKQDWESCKIPASVQTSPLESSSLASTSLTSQPHVSHPPANTRKLNNRRVIPDSSAESEEAAINQAVQDTSILLRTPTLIGSPGSIASTVSPIEISETQTFQDQASVRINVPPAPLDKSDWESLRESQFSNYEPGDITPSPLTSNLAQQPPSSNQQTPSNTTETLYQSSPDTLGTFISTSPRSSVRRQGNRAEGLQRALRYQPVSEPLSSAPWIFKSQIGADSQSPIEEGATALTTRSQLLGRCARKAISQRTPTHSQIGMAARGTRQSPRLQTAMPSSGATSPRIAVRTNSFRARAALHPPEHSSPLAVTAEVVEPEEFTRHTSDSSFLNNNILTTEQNSLDATMSMIPPTSIAPSAMHIDSTASSVLGAMSQDSSGYGSVIQPLTNPLHESIEDEPISSTEEASLASKASSSQESLRSERAVPQVDGLVMPTYPILGQDEYMIALPAEGKVQAIYNQTIKVKRKAVLKFIRRRGSVNTASTSANKTLERNEMIELIGRLHDTTTHLDLGLPGTLTQYSVASEEHATYAEYAGSKFVFLGYLMEYLQRRHETIVVMTKAGATQDLLEEYLFFKKVKVRRHVRTQDSQPLGEYPDAHPQVEILNTNPNTVVKLSSRPSLVIAFDASFEALDPQVKSLQAQCDGRLPIVHLVIANSSEHVERCLPVSMPSPTRLRLLLRATYQARMNLGGSPTIITNPSDEMDGRPMDLADINRAVRKSPNRKLQMVAAVVANATLSSNFAENWTLNSIPELLLDERDESPSTGSAVSVTPAKSRARSQTPTSRANNQARHRSRTPLSRAGTPSARKRQLEIDTSVQAVKRQRMTPVSELPKMVGDDSFAPHEQDPHHIIDTLRVELANERKARQDAEEAREKAEMKSEEWHLSLASLQHRYEKRTKKSHEQEKTNRSLIAAIESAKARSEKVFSENSNLRQQISQLKKDLEAARNDLKSAGGDVAVLEAAREDARSAIIKAAALERSLDNTKRDFEFLRTQYQDASSRAAELGTQVSNLEGTVATLSKQASEEKRRLKEINHSAAIIQYEAKIQQVEAEKRSIQILYRKLEEESKILKRNRGVQTRGSSTAPATPGQRSRQGSPALGVIAPPSGSRASALRHER